MGGSFFMYLGLIVMIAVIYKVLAYTRTREANLSTGCLACGANELTKSGVGKVKCLACGYEGSDDKGGFISEDDVAGFTKR